MRATCSTLFLGHHQTCQNKNRIMEDKIKTNQMQSKVPGYSNYFVTRSQCTAYSVKNSPLGILYIGQAYCHSTANPFYVLSQKIYLMIF